MLVDVEVTDEVEEYEALVQRARDTASVTDLRHAAFAKLVQRFQNMAYGYAYAILGDAQLAEEVAQEAFVTAYYALPTQPTMSGDEESQGMLTNIRTGFAFVWH